jgi:hypothetical protein
MLHEGVVGAVIGDVAEGDEAREQRDGRDHGDLGQTDDDHRCPLRWFNLLQPLVRAQAELP